MNIFYTLFFLVVIFVLVFIISYITLNVFTPTLLEKRLHDLFITKKLSTTITAITSPLSKPVKQWIEPLANAAMNSENWLNSPLRIKFSNAGLNSPTVIVYYFASKTALSIFFPFLILIAQLFLHWSDQWIIVFSIMLTMATFGYYLPNVILSQLIKNRQAELFFVLPDALDLLRVCVEAGLGLDAAVERVGREMEIESKAIAQEFTLLGLELRAGASRSDAMKNLALRIGMDEIDSLVSILIQSDRFGTSISDSLKMHSESLRSKRKLIAEEAAAKLPVKILMPLIFCIFPALLTVLLGPAVISIIQIVMPHFQT